MLFNTYWLLFLSLLTFVQQLQGKEPIKQAHWDVKEVRVLQEYYEKINNNNFTLVKYYTNWCSHCKKLKPIFNAMSKNYTTLNIDDILPNTFFNKTFNDLPNFFEEKTVNIDYVSIECEIFGSFEICKRWPGYPVVELVPPKTETNIHIKSSNDILENDDDNADEDMPMWLRVFTKIDKMFSSLFSGSSDLDDLSFTERSLEFKGSRTEPNLKNFIKDGIVSDYERLLIDYLINNSETGNNDSELVTFYNDWISNIGNKFIAVNKIMNILKADLELKELDDDVKRDLLFQKRILSTLIDIEEQKRAIEIDEL
ncbi:hypothetical protein ACO0SA_004885 [Hanseniaspora valbyensis]